MPKEENKAKLYLVKNESKEKTETTEVEETETTEVEETEVEETDEIKEDNSLEEETVSHDDSFKAEPKETISIDNDLSEVESEYEIDNAKQSEANNKQNTDIKSDEVNVNSDVTDEDILEAALDELDDIDIERLENMSDDEAILELDRLTGKNDELIDKDYLKALVNQGDRLVYYEIENIYNNEKKKTFKGRLKMRRDPPVLIIKDDYDNEAKFYLTENLTDELSETLRQVKRAYYGFNNPTDIDKPEKFFDRVKYYIKNNPFKILTTILLILFLLSLSI